MTLWQTRRSRRQFCQSLGFSSLLAALTPEGCQRTMTNALASSYSSNPQQGWALGIGADPYRYLWEMGTSPDVGQIARAWSPQFLSAWLNSPDNRSGDLSSWQHYSQSGQLFDWFDQGFSLHVITWENDGSLPTGNYHISQQYLKDLEQVAGLIRQANPADRPTYWTLATEFSYWRLPADTYNHETADYYQQLMKNLRRAKGVIKSELPNAWVAPSWGGWIATFDDPARGWGRSMIPPFAEFLQDMDGVAFQAMRPRRTGEFDPNGDIPDPGNPAQILQCCQVFSQYHHSFMVSHYEPNLKESHPNGGRADTVANDFLLMMRPNWLNAATRLGLNKFSLMHYGLYKGDPYGALTAAETFQKIVRQTI